MEEQGEQFDRFASSTNAGSEKDFDTRCSPSRFYSIIQQLSKGQKQVVKDLGFGSLLNLQCKILRQTLCKWLLDHFDVELSCLQIGKKRIDVTPLSVQRVMGLQAHGEEIPVKRLAAKETELMMKRYGLKKNEKIGLPDLEKKLQDRANIGSGFKRDFVLYACGSILYPTSALGASKRYLGCVSDSCAISKLNWAKIVYDCLIDSIKNYKKRHAEGSSKSTYVSGSLLYLQLLFCDCVVEVSGSPKPEGPAIAYLTDEDMKKVEETIGIEGGSSVKVVDCILSTKGYRDHLDPPDQNPLESPHHSADVSLEESKAAWTYDISEAFSKICINNEKQHLERLELLEKQLEELKSLFQDTRVELKQAQLDWREELKKFMVASSSYHHELLEENRLLYNQVQDLKGKIRVYCRVKPPFLPWQSTVDYIGENGDIIVVHPYKQGKEARKVFSFNKVFSTTITQEQIFADLRPLIRSVLDGYNVSIFAYGQTGLGKTYTMSGPDPTTEDTWGVNYRAIKDLFEISKERIDAITYEVSVQMIEIYNEQVRDLLVSGGSRRCIELFKGEWPQCTRCILIQVNCIQDVLDLMRTGQRNRAVGATALNERSSRSHSVLAIHVHGIELVSGSILRGCLHLVDLSGSERVDKSEAVGERLEEARYINRSLSALGDVIFALAQKSSHILYRNSKLTQVLQGSLGGRAKTLMLVHINPEANAIEETMSTLKFAERVASIELGAARSNKETGEIKELKEEISSLRLALQRKEAEMELKSIRTPRIVAPSSEIRSRSSVKQWRSGLPNARQGGIRKNKLDMAHGISDKNLVSKVEESRKGGF